MTEEEQWLADRCTAIGASESPALLGQGFKDQSPMTVWMNKVHPSLVPTEEEREELDWGHDMQPLILKRFSKKAGFEVRDLGQYTFLRHGMFPFIGATLDGVAVTPDGEGPAECKNVGEYEAREWENEPPLRVLIQIQQQIAVFGSQFGYGIACIGGRRLVYHRVERNEAFIAALFGRLTEFWQHVVDKTLPPLDDSIATSKALARLHPLDSGAAILLPPEAAKLVDMSERAAAHKKVVERLEREADNRLKAMLGDNTYGVLPDGRAISWKTQNQSAYTVSATTKRVLRTHKRLPKGVELLEGPNGQGAITDAREPHNAADAAHPSSPADAAV